MRYGADILALADRLVADAVSTQKTAAAAPAPQPSGVLHPIVVMLKESAAALREQADAPDVALEQVHKLASAIQRGTGAQSPSVGASLGAKSMTPALPSLQTSNLGVTAGTGGAAPAAKLAMTIRKIASDIRNDSNFTDNADEHTAHVLNAACGLRFLSEGISS